METVAYTPIGVIHTPFEKPEGMPIQPAAAHNVQGRVEVEPQYRDGLKDLDGFSHIILLYHFHLAKGYKLHVKPFLDNRLHGIFAVRAPKRPNPIGLSVVRLLRIEEGTLFVENIDVVDGTPLLDIKPHVPKFDQPTVDRTGWLSGNTERTKDTRSDGRFTGQ